jgi:hypothetical protein
MGYEQDLQRSIFTGVGERTFIDKVLAKDDVNAIREIIKKPKLTRSELLEVLYLICGTEAKLLNYNEWDRYIILKFFVWIREFIKIFEILVDYEDELYKKENTCTSCKLPIVSNNDNVCRCKNIKRVLILTERAKRLLLNNDMLLQHNAKFLIDLYLNIGRTSMSLTSAGFTELLRNKYEVQYMQPQGAGQEVSPQKQSWSLFKK